MIETSKLYKSIDFLNTEIYKPGKQHPLIYIKTVSTRDANRIPTMQNRTQSTNP
jgi:hypothetical protein